MSQADDWNEWEVSPQIVDLVHDPKCATVFAREKKSAAELNFSPWDLAIFHSIWYDMGQVESLDDFLWWAIGKNRVKNPEAASESVSKCFHEGWIQRLSPEFIREMQHELESGGYLMPRGLFGEKHIDEMVMAGCISYTRSGAARYMEWLRARGSDLKKHWAMEIQLDGNAHLYNAYGTSLKQCKDATSWGEIV